MNSNLFDGLVEEILQMQTDAGLPPGTSLSETLDRLLCPDFQLDGLTPGQAPPYASQQEHAVHVLPDIMSPPSQNQPAHFQPSPTGQSELDTMEEDASQEHAPLPPVMPASFSNQVAQVGESADAPAQCPLCGRNFPRWQERDRHVRTYLPYWLCCPFDRCSWRGNRAYDLKIHRSTTHAGEDPQQEDCIIYNPDPLVQEVVSGESSIERVRELALHAVKIQAPVLGKHDVWEGEWGRRQRIPH